MIRRDFYSHHHRIHENTLESTREEEEEEAGHGWQRRRGRLSARLVNNFLRLNASNAINSRFVLSSLYQLSECLQKRQEKQVALLLARKTFWWGGGGRFFPSDLSSRHARRKTKRNPPYWIFGSQQQRHRWSNSLSRRPFDYYLSLISKFRLAMALLKDPIWRHLAKLNISRTERGVSSMKQNRLLDFRIEIISNSSLLLLFRQTIARKRLAISSFRKKKRTSETTF